MIIILQSWLKIYKISSSTMAHKDKESQPSPILETVSRSLEHNMKCTEKKDAHFLTQDFNDQD